MKSFNTPQWVRTSLVSPLQGVTSPWNFSYRKSILVKLTLHLWHSKLQLSILINRMTSPQNCSYRKSIIIKFNTTPLTTESFNTPQRVQTSLISLLHGVTSSQNCSYHKSILVKLTLHLGHSKLQLFSSIEWQGLKIAHIANQLLSC